MDEHTLSREKQEEVRASLRELLNPERFLDSLGEKISAEDRDMLISQVNNVINEHLGPLPAKRNPPGTEIDLLEARFDQVLKGMSKHFPDGLPKNSSQTTSKLDVDKTLKKLDPYSAKHFEKELEFAKKLRKHPLEGFLNSLATDPKNAMPEARTTTRKGKEIESTGVKKFEYVPMSESTDASRLIVLHPGAREDEIKCNLIPLPLSILEAPDDKKSEVSQYEALSYVWGAQIDPVLIEIDGQDFQIGRNLYSALINLRFEDKDRLLWIDAICINQDDIAERNWQVSRMGLIYRSAFQTIAWLGPATWGSDMICMSIQALQSTQRGYAHTVPSELRNLNMMLFGHDDCDNSTPKANLDTTFVQLLWDQLDQIFERPLWMRSWVMQEIVLSRHVTVQCGTLSFPYDALILAFSDAAQVRSLLGLNAYTPLKTGGPKFIQFAVVRGDLRSSEEEVPLFRLAARYGRLLATDPRDKIYAILSLSPKLIREGKLLEHGFLPDYEKSTLEVYRDFTLFCIKKYNNFDVFSRPFRNNEEHPLDYENWVDDWPSWVPDWDRRGIKENDFRGLDAMGSNPFREFNASAGWGDVKLVEVNRRTIWSAGMVFDEVAAVVDGDIFQDPNAVAGDETEWDSWAGFALSMGDAYGYTAEEKEEAFWRTLVADADGKGEGAPQEFGEMYRHWRDNNPPLNFSENNTYKTFRDQLFVTTRGRKLFLTKRGYLGIGSWQIEEGNMVCILQGGKLPIVGRDSGASFERVQTEETEGASRERVSVYQLVGSGGTYIHGIMDGEAVGIIEEEGEELSGVFLC
ncbi:HET-domain-containing protein [Hyaloscypha variabilis F]|uniref:HET-domain-containing protein n=1 Tax=Hyaloscypha variabilis (strain UAMH 11265 / GT02V1 / F) TaxID=1149755 RepID=A0A2J6QT20_HYAVF|nr:HET-domain-containing protein [Hyaloscypha variabilis F]